MRFDALVVPLVLQLVLPIGLLARLAFSRHRNRAGWLLEAAAESLPVRFEGHYLVRNAIVEH